MIEFIVNPVSKEKSGAHCWELIAKELEQEGKEEGRDYRVHFTEYSGHGTVIAKELTEGEDPEKMLLVVVGGDGTLNEVLNGIHFFGVQTLGYIPAGSGNDFARGLKLEKNPVKAIQKILHPNYFRILDYGTTVFGSEGFRCKRFAVSSGIGYDAAVCERILATGWKRKLNQLGLGKLLYLVLGIREVFSTKTFDGYLMADDKKINLRNAMFVAAHIQPYEGGGFKFAPHANSSDGLLEVCVMNHMSRVKFFAALALSLLGKEEWIRGVSMHSCRSLEIHLEEPRCAHTDGEIAEEHQTDMQIECVTKKIRLIV